MAINVLVAIGGTGSRVAEAYVYSAASGLLKGNTKTLVFVVDKDIDCGNTTRLMKTIDEYRDLRECTGLDLPEIQYCTWCIEDAMKDLNPNVEKGGTVRYGQVAGAPGTNDSILVNFMHSRQEQDEFDLKQGFYGHPSLGAALYGLITETPSFKGNRNTLVQQIRQELGAASGKVSTFLVGSLFGGTGASLLPNVARTLHEDEKIGRSPNFRQAACLMLPYFQFQSPRNQRSPVNFADFDEKTATALEFYAKDENLVSIDNKPRSDPGHQEAVFDDVYLFGRKPLEPTCPSYTLGGKDQVHTFTVVDYFASLAAVEFFNGKTVKLPDGTPHLYSADMPTPCVSWPQVPNPDAQACSEQMLRFCYAYLTILYPLFQQDARALERLTFMQHLYGATGTFNKRANLPANLDFGKEVARVAPFCEKYMRFFSDLHRCNYTVQADSVNLFTAKLTSLHMDLLNGDQLQSSQWFADKYHELRVGFDPDSMLINQRVTRVSDSVSLQDNLNRYKFDLNAHPGLPSIYRAVYDLLKV